MTKRSDTTAVVSAIADGKFLGRTLINRQDAKLARELGERISPVFSATYEDSHIVGSASAYAVIADTRNRVNAESGFESALDLFGAQSHAVRATGKPYLANSARERMMSQAMNRGGGIVVDAPSGRIVLNHHGWIVV